MLWSSDRRRRRLEPPSAGLVHLTKWCTTLFIILESTSVGSGLVPPTTTINTSSTVSGPSSSASPASTTFITNPFSTERAPTVISSSTSASTDGTNLLLRQVDHAPRFAALVQSTASGHDRPVPETADPAVNSDPLLLLGGFRFPAQLLPEPISLPVDRGSGVRATVNSFSENVLSRTSPLVADSSSRESSLARSKSNIVNLGVSSSSSSSSSGSKIKSANLSVGDRGSSGKMSAAKGTSSETESTVNRVEGEFREIEGNFSKMFFETDNLTTISSQVGSIAVLPCVVRNIGEGVVSWIRRKDYHLLTIGVTTYSSDERFNIIRSEDSEEWPLQIKYVQLRDAGPYECQVSTHPPTSIFVQLDVVEAKAEIFGPSDKYLKPGSTLRLTCRVVQSNEPPLYIFWYHNNRMINYDVHLGVNVSTEADNRFSELVITHSNTLNSGNYSCVSNNAVAASTYVHILNGENPAAMQHGDHGNGVLVGTHLHLLVTVVTYQIINLLLCAH
ncbi:uncharacterized protein LOC5568978 [Aedes aegypti]|uniref:Ig-like domain-containing protein n=3 Tax=Aedes aegypti TaxID=7159 RepID=A0A1S4FFZ2_AEDAE|nr:uncharacterized protein LOC5568978 [Aedes aegypti]